LSQTELQAISQASCGGRQKIGPRYSDWSVSSIDDKIYCVYLAPNEELVRERARHGNLPANGVATVRSVIGPTIGPTTAES
jgi:uncharacterized protein DUF4242